MIFTETPLKNAFLIDLDKRTDDRGFFARSWCAEEFRAHGLNPQVVQANISFNARKHTLRGMHYQITPHEEAKTVRVTQGAVFDVIVDLRPESATYTRWFGVELSAENRRALYIPEGFAHGFLTLADATEVHYLMAALFAPDCARGVRWNDSAFGIVWPAAPAVISERDATWADFVGAATPL